MKLWIRPSDDRIIAVHDEDQIIPDDAYDKTALLPGETSGSLYTCVIAYRDDVPRPPVINGSPGLWTMPAGWDAYPDSVPKKITSTQGKLALLDVGKLDDAELAIDSLEGVAKTAAQLKFNAANWYRADPLFDQLGAVMGLNTAAIDDLFRAARKK